MQSQLTQLRLFQLISPTLPIGSFTYSQGMEWAIENGWINNPIDLKHWVQSVLSNSLAYLELPILIRLHRASQSNDVDAFHYWSQLLLAHRETSELRQEELNRARALLAVLNKLSNWPELTEWKNALLCSQASGFALAANYWGIDERTTLNGYTWAWLENGVNAAVKLVPLGQTDGQTILYQLANEIPTAIDLALKLNDEELGASTPALAIASSMHEIQYCRLFRS